MPDAATALEILDLSLVPGSCPPVYGIGLAASRITIADQQRRAVNLIWALLREGRVTDGDQIAIVGAGVAGATAAAYALKHQLTVSVFEKYDEPFALLQGSNRWIHPHIYDWPDVGWNRDRTDLPCMNWSDGTAGEVMAELRTEWRALVEAPALQWKPRSEVRAVVGALDSAYLIDSGSSKHGPFRAVIFAAGFGEEARRPEFEGKPYWRDDDLHQRLRTGGAALISGCGDSGLIDAIRVALSDFKHDWLATLASQASSDAGFVGELLRVERNTPLFPDGKVLTDATLAITAPAQVTTTIRAQLRPHTSVVLNGGADGPLTRGTCLINRFVISELMRLGVVSYRPGRLDTSTIERNGDLFRVLLDGTQSEFDVVVVRHGPVHPLQHFPALNQALDPARSFLRTYRAGVDRTRTRAWTPIVQRPAAPTVTASTPPLPPSSQDVLEFLGRSMQGAVKDEFSRREIRAVVGFACHNKSLDLDFRIGAHQDKVLVALITGTEVTLTHQRPNGAARVLSVTLPGDVMQDGAAAIPDLIARIPEVVDGIVGEL